MLCECSSPGSFAFCHSTKKTVLWTGLCHLYEGPSEAKQINYSRMLHDKTQE